MQSIHHRRRDVLLVIFASMGILGLLIRGTYLAVGGILTFNPGYSEGLASSLLGALSMLFCAAVLVPMLVLSLRALKGQATQAAIIRPINSRQLAALVLVWVVILILGSMITGLFKYGWAFAALLFLPGVDLPILLLVWIGIAFCLG